MTTTIFACQYCGGIEPYIIVGVITAWGWGCYMLALVFHWLRRKS
jgi:hypothetical protein